MRFRHRRGFYRQNNRFISRRRWAERYPRRSSGLGLAVVIVVIVLLAFMHHHHRGGL